MCEKRHLSPAAECQASHQPFPPPVQSEPSRYTSYLPICGSDKPVEVEQKSLRQKNNSKHLMFPILPTIQVNTKSQRYKKNGYIMDTALKPMLSV